MIENQNNEIREEARTKGVMLWQIAEKLGITDGNFSRKLHHELDDDKKQKIIAIIDEFAKEVSE